MFGNTVSPKKTGNATVSVATAIETVKDNLETLSSGTKRVAEISTKRVDLDKGLAALNKMNSDVQVAASPLNASIRYHN